MLSSGGNFGKMRLSSYFIFLLVSLILVFGLGLFSPLVEANTEPIRSGSILSSGVDARALGMGGAYVAVSDNYSAAYWNPAGVTQARPAYLGGMNMDKFGIGLNLNYLSGGFSPSNLPLTKSLPLPFGNVPLIQDFSLSGTYLGFSTNVRAADPSGDPIGEITYSERTYMGTTGFSVPSIGSIGSSLKIYRFRAPNAGVDGKTASASGIGFDLGLLAEPLENFWVGAAGFDLIGTEIKWKNTPTEQSDIEPSRYSVGAAYNLDFSSLPIPEIIAGKTTFAGQYTFGPNIGNKVRTGFEYTVSIIALRGGVVKPLESELEFSAGAGLKINLLSADVAWVQNNSIEGENTSDTIVLSTEFSF